MSDWEHTGRTTIDQFKKKPKTDWGAIFGASIFVIIVLCIIF